MRNEAEQFEVRSAEFGIRYEGKKVDLAELQRQETEGGI